MGGEEEVDPAAQNKGDNRHKRVAPTPTTGPRWESDPGGDRAATRGGGERNSRSGRRLRPIEGGLMKGGLGGEGLGMVGGWWWLW